MVGGTVNEADLVTKLPRSMTINSILISNFMRLNEKRV